MCSSTDEYTIFLSSNNAMSGNIGSKVYGFDWTTIPDGAYDLTFTFRSDAVSNMTNVSRITLPNLANFQSATASANTQAGSNSVIGLLKVHDRQALSYIYTCPLDNAPIRLPQKPNNNMFSVVLSQLDGADLTGAIPTTYNLILHLKKVD